MTKVLFWCPQEQLNVQSAQRHGQGYINIEGLTNGKLVVKTSRIKIHVSQTTYIFLPSNADIASSSLLCFLSSKRSWNQTIYKLYCMGCNTSVTVFQPLLSTFILYQFAPDVGITDWF